MKVIMLIDSASERCVMSRDLYERAKGLLPVDTETRWFIGSANLTMDKVFGVYHCVAVEVGGNRDPGPSFHSRGRIAGVYLGEKVGSLGACTAR